MFFYVLTCWNVENEKQTETGASCDLLFAIEYGSCALTNLFY